jgi:prepilin-type N-terminal cleavage/methylation domain-containing protein
MNYKLPLIPADGFTLIEVMIALVIMSIGLTALAAVQISAIRGNDFSKRMTTAISIAEAKMEQIKSSSYANILSESSIQITQSNMHFTRQVTVTNNIAPLTNTKTVNVTVSWSEGPKSHSVPITTIVSQ